MLASLTDRWPSVLPRAAAAALVAVTLLALAALVFDWQREAAVVRAGDATGHGTPTEASDPLPVILSGNVFGSQAASTQASAAPVRQASGYTLRAAFAADAGGGGAIIEATGAEARWYEAGDTLADGARLREVHPDHVVLERNGVAERLDFPKLADMPAAVVSAGSAAVTDGAPAVERGTSEPIPADAPAEEKARIIRQRLEELRNRSRS
jgi:general secretion pathway protein C